MIKEIIFTNSINYIQLKLKQILDQVSPDDINKVKNLFFSSNRIFVYGAVIDSPITNV